MKNNDLNESRGNFLREAEDLLGLNNLSGALELAEKRLREFPADADALGVCCEALIGMHRIGELRQLLDEVAGRISGLNLIYERAGDACRESGLHQEAAVCYERFLSLHPDTEKAGEIIGKMALLEQEDRDPANVNGADDGVPEKDFFTITMAQLYVEQGHLQDAEIILEEIIKKEPDNRQALNLLDDVRSLRIATPREEKRAFHHDNVIKILFSWLKNIERLKMNAAAK